MFFTNSVRLREHERTYVEIWKANKSFCARSACIFKLLTPKIYVFLRCQIQKIRFKVLRQVTFKASVLALVLFDSDRFFADYYVGFLLFPFEVSD